MNANGSPHRRIVRVGFCMGLLLAWSSPATAQEEVPLLYLRPHCEAIDQKACPSFEVDSPMALRTAMLQPGALLDIDVVLRNPSGAALKGFRAWLVYDARSLQGESVAIDSRFPLLLPGEASFSPDEGYVKIGADAAENAPVTAAILPLARVQFRIVDRAAAGIVPMSFYDYTTDANGHTFVKDAGSFLSLGSVPGSLLVRIAGAAAALPELPAPPPHEAAPPPAPVPFGSLQVQNVRVSSEGSNLLIAWDGVPSPEVNGYNVYYGTQMGRYIQRRSLPAASHDLILRDLPVGETYYVAVRAVSKSNEESAFSREAGVQIGKASTSTSPLRPGSVRVPPVSGNPLQGSTSGTAVPGESGLSSSLLLLLCVSAAAGVLIALRRQYAASPL